MAETPTFLFGFVFLASCASSRSPEAPVPVPVPVPVPAPALVSASSPPAASIPPESSLGIADKGIWSDLDDQVQLSLPADLDPARTSAIVTADGAVLVLYVDGWPVKAYPYPLRAGDTAELDGVLGEVRHLEAGTEPPPGDRDGDDLPDPLDVLIGAKKAALQATPYGGAYLSLEYPGGDLPRDMGVCTDVVIRSLRNAGLDLQVEVHKDIAKSRRSYPMVKGKGDANIDHRRVKTILPWFKRHAEAHTAELDDASDPYRPGDVVFLDTFPDKPGPDHIGVVSDHRGESGHLVVINAWTDGYVTQEMDLLGWVPVTHRFRL